jgi:hypothetical protein
VVPEVEVHELVLDDVGDDVPELVHDELVLDEVGDEVLELVLEGVDVQELDVQEPVLDDVVEEDVLDLPSFMCSMPLAVETPTVSWSQMFASCKRVPRAGVINPAVSRAEGGRH